MPIDLADERKKEFNCLIVPLFSKKKERKKKYITKNFF